MIVEKEYKIIKSISSFITHFQFPQFHSFKAEEFKSNASC